MSDTELHYFADIEPKYLVRYLLHIGWERLGSIGDDIAVFRAGPAGRIPVPISNEFDDYAERVRETLDLAAQQLAISQKRILDEVLNPPADYLRIHLDCIGHSLGLGEASKFYEGIHELCRVAVAQRLNRKVFYHSIKGTMLDRLERAWRVQPAKPGSYEVDVACPLDSLTSPEALNQLQLDLFDDPPDSRLVLENLDSSLCSILDAHHHNAMEDLVQAETPMISYNLCEALLNLQPREVVGCVEVHIDWSRELDHSPTPPRVFESRAFDFVERLAERLAPAENRNPQVTLVSIVSSLHGSKNIAGDVEGDVTLSTHDANGKPMSVRVYLDPMQYNVAHRAHGSGNFLSLQGSLIRRPRNNRLEQPFDAKLL